MSGPIKVNTRSQWTALNPVLTAGELGLESDTQNLKIGNGLSPWSRLPYHGCPGYWGSFWDLTSQTAAAINTPYAISLRSMDTASRGVRVTSNTRITVDHPGIYSFTFSAQLHNVDEQIHDVNIWLRKNDSGSSGDVPASDSRFSVPSSHGGTSGHLIGTVNFVLPLVANDYIELMWATTDTDVTIHAESAQTTPLAHPSIPGIICTVVQVASA